MINLIWNYFMDGQCLITAFATALVPNKPASPNKWSSISKCFSLILVIAPTISVKLGKYCSQRLHLLLIDGDNSLCQGIFCHKYYEIFLLFWRCKETWNLIHQKLKQLFARWIGNGISMLNLSCCLSHLIPKVFVSLVLTLNCSFTYVFSVDLRD